MSQTPKILIVAGGRSKRMGHDKSLIERSPGLRQIDALLGIAAEIGAEVLVSSNDPSMIPASATILADITPGGGPLAALEAFHSRFPGEPVLALSCDLFLLEAPTIRHLIAQRDPEKLATAFTNRIDRRAEPLCTIYEAAAVASASQAIGDGNFCARHFLEDLAPKLLELPDPVALDAANTPEELAEIRAKREHGVRRTPVRVLYFAKLREERGLNEEPVETLARTTGGLYEELRFQHRLSLPISAMRCAVNDEFRPWDTLLQPGDELILIPPVAGG